MDLLLYLRFTPAFVTMVVGVVSFVASFAYLISTLYSNSLPASPTAPSATTSDKKSISESTTDTTFIEAASIDADIAASSAEISEIYETFMVDDVPLIIEYWDANFDRIACNDTAAAFFSIPAGRLRINIEEIEFLENTDPEGVPTMVMWRENLQATFDRGFSIFEYSVLKDGIVIDLEVVARRKKMQSGYIVVTYIRDISAAKQVLLAKEEQAMAEARSQAKSRFLAHMSHEIRTPITAVQGIAEAQLHREKDLPQETLDAFQKIYNSSQTLIDIINDVLDISKIEAGKMSLNPRVYNVAKFVQDVTQIYAVFLENKKFDFILSVDKNLPQTLIGDELRIKQILNNLLSNAFKYTERGEVRFTITITEDTELIITVEDTGRGMSKDQVARLLSEEYVRFSEVEMPEIQGTGLGIAITQNLIQLLSAKMDIESAPNVGTKITVSIPQHGRIGEIGRTVARSLEKLESVTELPKLGAQSLSHGRVLVVDDMESNLYVVTSLLAIYNLQVETCQAAAPAIEKVVFGEEYDIIFMDITMPDLDGISATKMLRELGYKKPIVALSENIMDSQIQIDPEAILQPGLIDHTENGFDAYIGMPIQMPALHEILIKYI